MEEKFLYLSEQQLKELCERAAYVGVRKYLDLKNEAALERKDKRLHNTLLLRKNYKKFKSFIEKAVKTLDDIGEVEIAGINSAVLEIFGIRRDDQQLYSVQKSVATMTLIMAHVDRMLEVFKETCESSSSAVEKRKWYVIEHMYLLGECQTTSELSEELHIEARVIRRDAQEAREEIGVLLFGIESLMDDFQS